MTSSTEFALAGNRHGLTETGLCDRVNLVPLLAPNMLEKLDDDAGGYDCSLPRPLSCCQVLRLQATVLQPPNSDMLSPLALQMCVLYQVTVSRRLHAGMPPVPVAFSSMSSSFQVAISER